MRQHLKQWQWFAISAIITLTLTGCNKRETAIQDDWANYQVAQSKIQELAETKRKELYTRLMESPKVTPDPDELDAIVKDAQAAQDELTAQINAIGPKTEAVKKYHAAFAPFAVGSINTLKINAQAIKDRDMTPFRKANGEYSYIQSQYQTAKAVILVELTNEIKQNK